MVVLTQLPFREQSDLRQITKNLIRAIRPNTIYCYGSREQVTKRWSCFSPTHLTEIRRYSYDLLVIVSDHDSSCNRQLFAPINAVTANCAHTNVSLHRRGFVEAELDRGSLFFRRVVFEGICLYDKGQSLLSWVASHVATDGEQPEMLRQEARQILLQASTHWQQANQHQASRKNLSAMEEARMSLEYALRSLLLFGMAYWPLATNLTVLLDYTLAITPEPAKIFPGNTREEYRLQRLSVENLVKDELPPTFVELNVIIDRAERMNRLVAPLLEKICLGKLL